MTGTITKGALGIALLSLLAACGTQDEEGSGGVSTLGIARQAAGQILAERRAASQPQAPARTPEQMAAEALRVNPGPLILVGLESAGRTQVLAMTGQNGAMRTYMTENEQALILRNGMLIGTRGLGNDMSVTEPATESLIRAGRAGTAQRVIRYYAGDGLERPLTFNCTVGAGPNPGVMVENCEGLGVTFQNSFMVQGGQIPVSRQWAGPGLGYITVQTLRP
ncbi:YjbF family lipoprotein [Paracoccus sp. M683]|uniref:YjbF family lipoprotein n=1 Tax=Paracoccus sp. M683 TaxID=2594268 RepID=UPI00117DF387|nr:YjbF family lipoprotein [Paracoccus sp. M683]TRW97616.1 YjbF family lipoprotein [Paracoccus sp. M683]